MSGTVGAARCANWLTGVDKAAAVEFLPVKWLNAGPDFGYFGLDDLAGWRGPELSEACSRVCNQSKHECAT